MRRPYLLVAGIILLGPTCWKVRTLVGGLPASRPTD
jgi:hypothetical protein